MKIKAARSTILVAMLLFIFNTSIAQSSYFEAQKLYNYKEYKSAIPLFIKTLSSEVSTEILEQLAYCYFFIEDYQQAEITYKKAIDRKDNSPNVIQFYAECLQKNERLEEAISQYEKLKELNPQLSLKLSKKIAECKQALEWIKMYQKEVYLENLKNINSVYDESGIHLGNNYIYFGSSRVTNSVKDEVLNKKLEVNHYRIFASKYSQLNDLKSIKTPFLIHIENLKETDDLAHPTFNATEEICYYTKSYSYTMGNKKFEKHEEETFTDIYIYQSKQKNNRWLEPTAILHTENTNYNMLHPCMSKDGNRLYFTSNLSGGYGSFDIYYVEKQLSGNWSKPINMGNSINTKDQELYPSYADENVLYFSSDGHIGMGDLDMFKATLENGKVVSIENLKYPLNSTYNDHSFVPTPTFTAGLFCSNRPGGVGNDDIYYFRIQR